MDPDPQHYTPRDVPDRDIKYWDVMTKKLQYTLGGNEHGPYLIKGHIDTETFYAARDIMISTPLT
jgi:hypothetical protein